MAKVALEKKGAVFDRQILISYISYLVTKALETSVLNGILKEKVIGKQKIFYVNQNSEIADRIKQLENEGTRESSVAENGKKIMELENKVIAAKQKRKRIAINMINTIWENSNLPKKQLLDTIGVDVKDHEL
uniref:TBPIP domain-containing protein n=1 Tax=Heterorhabditis bacteriophora TaxID=37862 RepID=A0A1I7W752_HETBA